MNTTEAKAKAEQEAETARKAELATHVTQYEHAETTASAVPVSHVAVAAAAAAQSYHHGHVSRINNKLADSPTDVEVIRAVIIGCNVTNDQACELIIGCAERLMVAA